MSYDIGLSPLSCFRLSYTLLIERFAFTSTSIETKNPLKGLHAVFVLQYTMRLFHVKKFLLLSFLILSTQSVFAQAHQFKYTPSDTENVTATVSNATAYTDSNGVQYWVKNGSGRFVQNNATWTTSAYVYVFVEDTSNWLYNQSYIYGSSTYTNLSFYSGFGNPPDKITSFTVDGKTISMYRYYTLAGLTFPTFETNLASAVSARIYGFYPSNSFTPPAVTNQATMYSFLSNFINTATRIIDFTPAEGAVLSSGAPVNFSLDYYLNPEDVGTVNSVRVTFTNIDQNAIFSSFSNNTIEFVNYVATTSGQFNFASSTYLPNGNYRINATLERSWVFGYLRNPFSSINTDQSHQFIVGSSTFIGNISQNSFSAINSIYNSFSSTSTASLSQSCNVLSGFDTNRCLAYLFIPSGEQINSTLESMRSNILVKAPWGYFNRMYVIWQTTATGTLPSMSISIPFGNGQYGTASADMGDMIVGGVSMLNSVTDPRYGKTARDILEPFVALLMAIAVIYTIVTDLTGSHKHNKHT